jgi:iron complex transport system substrate-binding protein
MRIVSLLPSSTEIVCALGFEDALVARSHECDFPASVKNLPVVTAPKFNPKGSSSEVDQRVKTILQEATSVYQVDAETLKSLHPDIIITQQQCEVCAVSFDDVKQVVGDYLGDTAEIISLEPNALQDVFNDIQRVADALDAAPQGHELILQMKTRMNAIAERAALQQQRPTVASIEWIDPLMAGGNWMPTLVEMAGGTELFGKADEHSHWITWDNLKQADPDVLVILPCGYDIPKAMSELSVLCNREDWGELAAVKNNRVYITDGNQYFNRPGPRLVESLEILAEILYPNIFDFNHDGRGWVRLEM